MRILGGSLEGAGTIVADLVNAGRVTPGGRGGVGALRVEGDYFQTADGVLEFEIGGVDPGTGFDQLAVSGAAALDGTLRVGLLGNGFRPNRGDLFQVVASVGRSGEFAHYEGLYLGDRQSLNPIFSAEGVALEALGVGITVSPSTGLVTTEAGGTARFTVVLDTRPTADVVVELTSSNPSEGLVAPSRLVFTPSNWRTPQTATITGVNTPGREGEIPYTILVSPATSADPKYGGLAPINVSVTNVSAQLSISLNRQTVVEGGSVVGSVTRNRAAATPLIVILSGDNPALASFPGSVVIPAGQTSISFVISTSDDDLVNGSRSLKISAAAGGHETATATLAVLDDDEPTLRLVLDESTVEEGYSITARVERNWITQEPLTVLLRASSAGQLDLPVVVIGANQAFATFTINTIQNTLPERDERLMVFAEAAGFLRGEAELTVTDHEDLPTLSITPEVGVMAEDGEGLVLTVSRAVAVDSPLTVKLFTSDAAVAHPVVATVVIPSGERSATFVVKPVDNNVIDGTRSVIITAHGAYADCGCTILIGFGTATLQVTDDDAPTLRITTNRTTAMEGLVGAFTITLSRNTTLDEMVVSLRSDNLALLNPPPQVLIPAGQSSVTIGLDTGADHLSLGPRIVTLTATADAAPPAILRLTVLDRDTADLRADEVVLPNSGLLGQSALVSWMVSNTGRTTAPTPWVERVYLSLDGVLDETDQLVAEIAASGAIAAGASVARSVAINLPDRPGSYFAIVVVDAMGQIPELNETDNRAVSRNAIVVSPTYVVSASTDTTRAVAGTPVRFSGTAVLSESSAPAAGVPATIRVISENGIRRVLTATTDAFGRFTATFVPLPNEAGSYRFAAAHPAVAEDVVQGRFELVGMKAEPGGAALRIIPGSPLAGSIDLRNLGDVDLTGLSVTVLDAPPNVVLTADLDGDRLPGHGVARLSYTALAVDASVSRASARLRVTSAEGASTDLTFELRVEPLVPRLVADEGPLVVGVVRGRQRVVSLQIRNLGGAPTGPLRALLPSADLPWLGLASGTTIPSLAPDQWTAFTLTVTPPSDAPLGRYEGTIALVGDNVRLELEYQIRVLADSMGDLTVLVEDEYTYYVAGAPRVADARVLLRDPYDHSTVVAEGKTDAHGRLALSRLPEGTYLLEIQSDQHGAYQAPIVIEGGILNEARVLISREMVRYNWDVRPTEIPDVYQVQLQSTFQTGVPIPVVTIETPDHLPELAPGQEAQVEFKVVNHGLIAAEGVVLQFGEHSYYEIIPLVTDIGSVPAKSELTIPAIIRAKPSAGAFRTLASPSMPMPICETLVAFAMYGVWCGNTLLQKVAMAALTAPGIVYGCGVEGLLLAPIANWILGGGGGSGGTGGNGGAMPSENRFEGARSTRFVPATIGGFWRYCPEPVIKSRRAPMALQDASSDGVCAEVRIQIDQTAVTARSAFTGGLTITNNSRVGGLTGVKLELEFRDALGNLAGDKFVILGPELDGLTAVDGTGVVAPGGSGLARYTFIPTREAAPDGPASYLVSGFLSYIDPESGLEVTIPLMGAAITVLPDPLLQLHYFQQRDVIGDDPFTDEIESSEPFALALMVTNSGLGSAQNFTVTSAQPRIIENEKGLLVDFEIVGAYIGDQPAAPSLTVNLGDLAPGQTRQATWLLTSSLLGRFTDHAASFQHSDALGGARTSIIDTVTIHDLIRVVRADRPGDDALGDFLVNDDGDEHALPDTLYLSDGTVAPVRLGESIAVDGTVSASRRQVRLTAVQGSGWTYLRLPDPGVGWRLARVARSDGKELLVETNVWRTTKEYDVERSRYVANHQLHLLDFDGTGDYTLYFVRDDSIPPAVLSIGSVHPDPRNAAVDSLDVTFSEEIDLQTFDWRDLVLTRDGGANLIASDSGVVISRVEGTEATYRVGNLTGLTTADGVYEFRVIGAGIRDFGDNAGVGVASVVWSNGAAAPYIKTVGPVAPARNTPLDALEVEFSKPIDPSTFDAADLALTRDGQTVSLSGVTVETLSETRFRVTGLTEATTADGSYLLTIDATGIADPGGRAGVRAGTASWTMDAVAPRITALETPATNPRNVVVQSLEVIFDKEIDPATFTTANILVTRDGVVVPTDGRLTIEPSGGSAYRIRGLNWFVGMEGAYVVTVDAAGVFDRAGNAATGSVRSNWVMDVTPPEAPRDLAASPDRGVSETDGLTNSRSLVISGALAEAGLRVRLVDSTTGIDLGQATVDGLNFSVSVSLTGSGAHVLRVIAIDAAGNISEPSLLELFIDETPPEIVGLLDATAGPLDSPFEAFEVSFSEVINPATLDWRDFSLTRDGGPNLIAEAVTITPLSATTYRVDGLAALADLSGLYVLTVHGAGIEDLAGNAGIGADSLRRRVERPDPDVTPPSSSVWPLPAVTRSAGIVVSWSGSDNPGGSGIAFYDIFVSIDGGEFLPWLEATTLTTAVYEGRLGHSFAFFSIATDMAGNVEAAPASAEAETRLPTDPTAARILETIVQGGLTQRSYVDRFDWVFSKPINLDAVLADDEAMRRTFSLTSWGVDANQGSSTVVPLRRDQFRYGYDDLQGAWVLTWSLDAFAGSNASLGDGYYVWEIRPDVLFDDDGFNFDGDGDRLDGGVHQFGFHRLQGDVNGDMMVDEADMAIVVAAWNSAPGSATWNPNADLNRNGKVDLSDRLLTMARGRTIIPPRAASRVAGLWAPGAGGAGLGESFGTARAGGDDGGLEGFGFAPASNGGFSGQPIIKVAPMGTELPLESPADHPDRLWDRALGELGDLSTAASRGDYPVAIRQAPVVSPGSDRAKSLLGSEQLELIAFGLGLDDEQE